MKEIPGFFPGIFIMPAQLSMTSSKCGPKTEVEDRKSFQHNAKHLFYLIAVCDPGGENCATASTRMTVTTLKFGYIYLFD